MIPCAEHVSLLPSVAPFLKSITRANDMAKLPLRITVAHRHAIPDELMKLLVMLEQ